MTDFNADAGKILGILGGAGAIGYGIWQKWYSTRKLDALKSDVDLDTLSGYGKAMSSLSSGLERAEDDIKALRIELEAMRDKLNSAYAAKQAAEEALGKARLQIIQLGGTPI